MNKRKRILHANRLARAARRSTPGHSPSIGTVVGSLGISDFQSGRDGLPNRVVRHEADTQLTLAKGESAVNSTPKPTDRNYGLQVPVTMKHGLKYRKDKVWVLVTRRGVPLAEFPSESELDKWWQSFQVAQGRIPKPLKLIRVREETQMVAQTPRKPSTKPSQRQTKPPRTHTPDFDPPPPRREPDQTGQWW